MKKMLFKLGNLLAMVALFAVQLNVNATCDHIYHQPELPKEAAKLRKF